MRCNKLIMGEKAALTPRSMTAITKQLVFYREMEKAAKEEGDVVKEIQSAAYAVGFVSGIMSVYGEETAVCFSDMASIFMEVEG